jgi:hypothetical protein
MFKKAVQQGRSKREAEAYAGGYVEASSDARTPLADFFNILLVVVQWLQVDGDLREAL